MTPGSREEMLLITDSHAVTRLDYNEAYRALDVTFSNGATYRYYDVSPEVYEEAKTSPSIGRYIQQHIRDNYNYTRGS